MSKHSTLMMTAGFVLAFMMLLSLSMSLILHTQVAMARKHNTGDVSTKGEAQGGGAQGAGMGDGNTVINLKNEGNAIASGTGTRATSIQVNVVCMKNSLCLFGFNSPFILSTPH
jgi:hypothetical protein